MIYLASPYSHPSEIIRHRRYLIVSEFVWQTMQEKNICLFSPIVYCHEFSRLYKAPTDAGFWTWFNLRMFDCCDELWILSLSGWQTSIGVTEEIRWAEEAQKPIRLVEPPRDASI
jgi:hypothetical protein